MSGYNHFIRWQDHLTSDCYDCYYVEYFETHTIENDTFYELEFSSRSVRDRYLDWILEEMKKISRPRFKLTTMNDFTF